MDIVVQIIVGAAKRAADSGMTAILNGAWLDWKNKQCSPLAAVILSESFNGDIYAMWEACRPGCRPWPYSSTLCELFGANQDWVWGLKRGIDTPNNPRGNASTDFKIGFVLGQQVSKQLCG